MNYVARTRSSVTGNCIFFYYDIWAVDASNLKCFIVDNWVWISREHVIQTQMQVSSIDTSSWVDGLFGCHVS